MNLETRRLFLREMTPEDYEALYAVLADPGIMQHYPYTFDEKRVRGWISRNIERYRIFGFGLWALCLKETGEMIGDCGLTMQPIHDLVRPEIGYHLRADMQRKGYASEAARAVRDWAFRNTPFGELYSYMMKSNVNSARCAMSYGAKLVDEYEDEGKGELQVYAISREEWRKLISKQAENAMRVIRYEEKYRDDMLYMMLEAKNALGRVPRLNEDLLDVRAHYLEQGDGFFLALGEDDRVLGCGGYSRVPKTAEAVLHRLYVKADRKRCGIGTALLNALEKEMKEKGITVAKVHLGDPVQYFESYFFYPKHGYRQTGPEPDIMEKEL